MSSYIKLIAPISRCRNFQRKKRKAVPKERSQEEKQLIQQAKELLMIRNNMTEEEAHRYMQKTSMDSGTGLTDTAQMILSMLS